MNYDQLRQAERVYRRDFPSPSSRREREKAFQAECAKPSVPVPGSVTLYRLVLSHPDWPRETRTKWQESPDFTKALAKAKELGVTARVESQNAKLTDCATKGEKP